MQNMANPFLGVYQTQIEASRRFLDTIFSSTEKIDQVVRGAAHRAVNEQLNLAEAFTQARDPASIGAAWQSGIATRNSDQAVNYQRELVRIVVEMQSELGQGVQDYVEQLRTQATSGFKPQIDIPAAQPAVDTASNFNPMTNLLSVWQNAFKEASSLAQRNLSTFNDAVGSAAQQSSRYVNGTAGTVRDVAEGAVSSMASATETGVNAAAQASESASEALASNAERKPAPVAGGKKK